MANHKQNKHKNKTLKISLKKHTVYNKAHSIVIYLSGFLFGNTTMF